MFKEFIDIKRKLVNLGAIFSNLSGSGSSVIGAFPTKKFQMEAYRVLKNITIVIWHSHVMVLRY